MHRAPSMASNVEQRLLALEQGLLRVAALEQSHAQIAQLHDMQQVQTLVKKINDEGHRQPKKRARVIDVAAAPDVGGEVPPPPPPPPRPKKVPKEKVPKAPREPKPPKPAKTSVESGHSKADSLFMQFARLERDVWNQDVVVASLISLPKIELHHKAILGRLAYEIKQRQQSSGRPQKNTFVTTTLDLVNKLGDEKDRNRNKLLVRRACVAYAAWVASNESNVSQHMS